MLTNGSSRAIPGKVLACRIRNGGKASTVIAHIKEEP